MYVKTIITNKTDKKRFFAYIPPLGRFLNPGESVEIDSDLVSRLEAAPDRVARLHLDALKRDLKNGVVDVRRVGGSPYDTLTLTDTSGEAGDADNTFRKVTLSTDVGQVVVVAQNNTKPLQLVLPKPRVGLSITVVCTTGQKVTVVPATGSGATFIADDNVSATTVVFTDVGVNPGTIAQFVGISDTKYVVLRHSNHNWTVS